MSGCPYPTRCHCRKFHLEVRPLFLLRERLSAESAALAELRDTLLPGLLAGEMRIRDAEQAAADSGR